ncbi:MAG: Purine-nucleoside phosphorylase [Thermoleophilia bacterium]|nr:Purine-nucleoside phosphorylase [Thermoleophilia bacterium]
MPIHLRAEQGDYAEAVLVPGDPVRAKYIADTFFEGVRQVNGERGMLGYTGTFKGKPVSVQSTGMGCPSAAIVFEELNMLGAKKIIRVGTCGGLQPGMTMGELVIATSATPADQTAINYTGGEMHAPTADFGLVLSAVKAAQEVGRDIHVGNIVSSDVFYQPDTGMGQRWSDRGTLAVEMEAAVLFTVAALRNLRAAAMCTISDIVVDGEFVRISDEELKRAVDEMMEIALEVAIDETEGLHRVGALAASTTA